MPELRSSNLVGGAWTESAQWLEVRDPADDREIVGRVPSMSADEVLAAFDAASDAGEAWRETSPVTRGRVLLRAAALLRERRPQIAALITRENGKTLAEAGVEVDKSADFFEFYAGVGRARQGELLAHERPGVTVWTRHEPVGVVLAITPWNDPLLTPARKLAPALIAGNTVVLKPASNTPLIALELARALHDAGLPAGVLNTVTGSGSTIGDALLSHPALAAVSFTGSNEVGARLRSSVEDRGIRLQAELGGKNAAVVLADADLDLAATAIAAAGFGQTGQRCTATSRVIAQRPVLEPLLQRLAAATGGLVVGPGLDGATNVGPLSSPQQRDDVLGFIERAVGEGASVHTGGGRPDGETTRHGCFVAPTILTDVTPQMEIWTEEVFGPVLAVLAVDDEDEALAVLNASRYGLAAGIYTRDLGAAHRLLARADTGQVAINLPTPGWDVHMPFGGFKESGSGYKEQGLDGLAFYLRVKTIAMAA